MRFVNRKRVILNPMSALVANWRLLGRLQICKQVYDIVNSGARSRMLDTRDGENGESGRKTVR